MAMSPCMCCTRVGNPEQCENKECAVWRKWFTGRWDEMRLQTRLSMERVQTRPEGVNIGGTYYAPPHRVKRYLDSDPCEGCLCPRDLCVLPCKQKRQWLQARENTMIIS